MKVAPHAPRAEASRRERPEPENDGAFAQLLGIAESTEDTPRPAARDLAVGLDDAAPAGEVEGDDRDADEAAELADAALGGDEVELGGVLRLGGHVGKARARGVAGAKANLLVQPAFPAPGKGPATSGPAASKPAPWMGRLAAPLQEGAQAGRPVAAADPLLAAPDTEATPPPPDLSAPRSVASLAVDAEALEQTSATRPMAALAARAATEPEAASKPVARPPLGAPMTVSLQLATLAHEVVSRVAAPDAPPPTFELRSVPQPAVASAPAGQDAFIHIDHPDLGRIRLQLQIEARNMRVRAVAESVAAAAALRDSEDEMRDGVARHGVELARLRVDVEDRRREGEQ